MIKATPETLGPLVESPEPSVDGDWYVLDLQALMESGHRYMEIHFDSGSTDPNEVRFLDEGGN